jgi:hypothetical protein
MKNWAQTCPGEPSPEKNKTQKQFGIITRTTRFSQKGRTYQQWFKLQIAGWTYLAK